jgi:hypothetical protein
LSYTFIPKALVTVYVRHYEEFRDIRTNKATWMSLKNIMPSEISQA